MSLIEPADIATPIWQKSRQAADNLRTAVMGAADAADVPAEVREAYARDIAAMHTATSKSEQQAIPVAQWSRQ